LFVSCVVPAGLGDVGGEGSKRTGCRGLRVQESHLGFQVFDPLLRVGCEVGVIRQPDAAVGTGVHAWCLCHGESHRRGHWSVCDDHETGSRLLLVFLLLHKQVGFTLYTESEFERVSRLLCEVRVENLNKREEQGARRRGISLGPLSFWGVPRKQTSSPLCSASQNTPTPE
jgi:hypothetical protein